MGKSYVCELHVTKAITLKKKKRALGQCSLMGKSTDSVARLPGFDPQLATHMACECMTPDLSFPICRLVC